MINRHPLLTIAIPTYNSAHFLRDSIESVLRQGLSDYELVIIDNASEDNTEDIVLSFNNDRIRYFRNDSNVGSRENHNLCLERARGFYFKFLCADDVLQHGILSKQLAVLESMPDVTLVSCNILETDTSLGNGRFYSFLPGACTGTRVINLCLSRLGNYIGGPSNFMFRLADAKGITMDARYRYVSDLRLGLKLLERGNYVNVDEVGYLYRRHANSDSEINCPSDIRVMEFFGLEDEFNWWNPLSLAEAARRGGAEGKRTALRNWRKACRPVNLKNALTAVPDILHMWRLDKKRGKPGALCLNELERGGATRTHLS